MTDTPRLAQTRLPRGPASLKRRQIVQKIRAIKNIFPQWDSEVLKFHINEIGETKSNDEIINRLMSNKSMHKSLTSRAKSSIKKDLRNMGYSNMESPVVKLLLKENNNNKNNVINKLISMRERYRELSKGKRTRGANRKKRNVTKNKPKKKPRRR